jgi:plasmid maintenance system antidote protein VapI
MLGLGYKPMRLGEILLAKRLITRTQLASALEVQRAEGGRLGEILVRQGLLSPADLHWSLQFQWRRLAAAAAMGLGAVVATPGLGPGATVTVAATVAAVAGAAQTVDTFGGRHRITPGMTIQLGDIVETSAGARVEIELSDHSHVVVDEATTLAVDATVAAAPHSIAGHLANWTRGALRVLASLTTGKAQTKAAAGITIGIRG